MQTIISRETTATIPQETVVDRAFRLNNQINELKKELEELKDELKLKAQTDDLREIFGVDAVAKISDSIEWDVNTELLIDWLKKNKKSELIYTLLVPSIREIKKYLGEVSLTEFAQKDVKAFSRIRFTKR